MNDADAIRLVSFDDEPQPLPSTAVAAARPGGRPRPDSSEWPGTGPVSLFVVDSDPEPGLLAGGPASTVSVLAFDYLVFDPTLGSFLVVYPAGASRAPLKPRMITIHAHDGPAITSLTVYTRPTAGRQPTPFRTFQFREDVRGKCLTFRFANPNDPSSLTVEVESSGKEADTRDESNSARPEPPSWPTDLTKTDDPAPA